MARTRDSAPCGSSSELGHRGGHGSMGPLRNPAHRSSNAVLRYSLLNAEPITSIGNARAMMPANIVANATNLA
eukprot:2590002-Prymnesium_polylepis.1